MRRQLVLPGYSPIIARGRERLRTAVLLTVTVILGLWAGLGVGILPPQLLFLPALPVIVMVPVILWLAPDLEGYPEAWMSRAFAVSIVLSIVWPRYLAFDLPGLPWITITRVAFLAFALLVVFSIATSSTMRGDLAAVLNFNPVVKFAFLTFLTMQVLTTIGSAQMQVVSRFVNNQIYWTAMFLFAGHFFSRPGRLRAALPWLVCLTALLCIIGLAEFRVRHLLWIDYIHYFNIEPDLLDRITQSNNMRPGTDKYRTRGVFMTPLDFSEFCALAAPFIWYYLLDRRPILGKMAAFVLLLGLVVTVWATDSRLGMIGFFVTLLSYPLMFAVKRWRSNKSSMIGPAVALAYPFGALAVGGAIAGSHSLATALLGGGQHQSSDEARLVQWGMGLRKLPYNPVGHGPGAGAAALGFYSPAGVLTVDSYYLTLLMDYGVLGAISFLVFFAASAVIGISAYLRGPRGGEIELAGPAGLALVNFMITKMVLSEEANHWLAFTLAGAIIGVGLQLRQRNTA